MNDPDSDSSTGSHGAAGTEVEQVGPSLRFRRVGSAGKREGPAPLNSVAESRSDEWIMFDG